MIPPRFVSASLSDDSMMLSEEGATAAFLRRSQKPDTFDAWAAHIREHWTEQPGELFGYTRPQSDSEQATP